MDNEENKAEGMGNAAKLGIIAGTLGLTGLIAWAYSDKGPLGAMKTARGASRTYLAGGGETTSTIAAKYNASGHEVDLISTNPGLNWPLAGGEHVVIPDAWALLYSTKTSSGPNDPMNGNHPGGWPNTSLGGHYTDLQSHHMQPDFAGWAAQHLAGAAGAAHHNKSPEFHHGHQVGLQAAKLHPGSPVTANVSTKNGGADLWNGTTWVKTSTDFQHGWHAGLLEGRHHGVAKTAAPHAPTSEVSPAR